MDHDRHAVGRELAIELDRVDPELERGGERRVGVLGRPPGGTAVRDPEARSRRRPPAHRRRRRRHRSSLTAPDGVHKGEQLP